MTRITEIKGKQEVIEIPANSVLFRVGDELLALSKDYSAYWTPRTFLWAGADRTPRHCAETEIRSKIAAEIYANKTKQFNVLRPLSPRLISGFQFWLRNKLTRWNLI